MNWKLLILLCLLPHQALAQCIAGPDAQSQRALATAFEAQSAVHEQIAVAQLDRDSRELSRADEYGQLSAQATLSFGTSSVKGFAVCDAVSWEDARLANHVLSGGAGLGVGGIARVELRALGVSDNIVQRDLSDYYPEREAELYSDVPGATGAGHGLLSARLELLGEVSVTIGRVSSHAIAHRVGWSEETDDEGNTSLVKSHQHDWGPGASARTFVAVGAPRIGATDLIVGDGRLERFALSSPWIVLRPSKPLAVVVVDGGYDGLTQVPTLGFEVSPVGGPFADSKLPDFRFRSSAELSSEVLREASIGARRGIPFSKFDPSMPGELWAVDMEAGLYGGRRLGHPVPGGVLRADFTLPILAVLRLSTWAAVNRQELIQAVPDAVGQPEWGISFYATYASRPRSDDRANGGALRHLAGLR